MLVIKYHIYDVFILRFSLINKKVQLLVIVNEVVFELGISFVSISFL